jgi:beta-glucanase (GH16 family)
MKAILGSAAVLLATASLVNAQAQKCSPDSKCPDSAPCCSQYGQCGVGAYCLGGCDPTSSFSLQSCMAAPTCKSTDYKLDSLSDVAPNTKYLGDASKVNWVSSGTTVEYNGDSLLLTMAPSTVGTLLSSTHYVWYGKISVTMTSSQGPGVVTAFILMSDVKDEIDFEFVGDDVSKAQSNYYYQGITNCKLPTQRLPTRRMLMYDRSKHESTRRLRYPPKYPHLHHRLETGLDRLVH